MSDPQKPRPVRTSTYLDADTRERLDAFCHQTKRNVGGAIEFFVTEGLDAFEAQSRRSSAYQNLASRGGW